MTRHGHRGKSILSNLRSSLWYRGCATTLDESSRGRLNDGIAMVGRGIDAVVRMHGNAVAEPTFGEGHFSNVFHAGRNMDAAQGSISQ